MNLEKTASAVNKDWEKWVDRVFRSRLKAGIKLDSSS
jgi:hypothetical protein